MSTFRERRQAVHDEEAQERRDLIERAPAMQEALEAVKADMEDRMRGHTCYEGCAHPVHRIYPVVVKALGENEKETKA